MTSPRCLIASTVAAVVVASSLVWGSPAHAAGLDSATEGPVARDSGRAAPRDRVLSDERTLSRWAHVERTTWARTAPRLGTRRVLKLQRRQGSGARELVLAMASRTTASGTWLRVRLPMRPNGRTGWVPARNLGSLHEVREALRIDRTRQRAVLLRDGRRVWSAPIGVGALGTSTPAGRFYVRDRVIPFTADGIYGPFAFGLSAYAPALTDWPGGGIVGIHGTDQPQLLPGRVSHGCIRLRNRDVLRLERLMPMGTPVLIR